MATTTSGPIANESNSPGAIDARSLAATLDRIRAHSAADPYSNPILLFALDLTLRIDRGEIDLDGLEKLVGELTLEAFRDRALRLASYVGETSSAANLRAIKDLIERKARGATFEEFTAAMRGTIFGAVFTAHPTFSISLELARKLVELATGQTISGLTLDREARDKLMNVVLRAEHRPPAEISLEIEHAWAIEALNHAHDALDEVNRTALRHAREQWPEHWMKLEPHLITLASWVGYDQDGRTDVTWTRTFAARLSDKLAMLRRYRAKVGAIQDSGNPEFRLALEALSSKLDSASAAVTHQRELLAEAERDLTKTAAFARAMVSERDAAMTNSIPLLELIDLGLNAAPDDDTREALLVLRASLTTHGLGLAHIHVRLNASQLHNAVRRQVGLDTEPNDPANRRSYISTINDWLGRVRPQAINFRSLMDERASAKCLVMTVAQILKFVDAETPIRFLIAETETGFTLLTALYCAKLFGVEDRIEISPLFETEEAFARGERVIDEALRSPHYRAWLERQGRIAVQFGFSDSGRFIGQLAATFRIERLRLRLAQLLERHGLNKLDVILFNTHGESIGRGGHPLTLADRLRYAAPPASRAEFERRGLRVKEEISFQGGDGDLLFLNPAAAIASVRQILSFAFDVSDEAANDPIYSAPDYVAEFFATVQQDFTDLVGDPDYAALLSLFGSNLLYRTGSRPVAREAEEWKRQIKIEHPSQIRAITNNAVLQQLGFMAITLYGAGRAVSKDPEMFRLMRERSPRFGRAMRMVAAALDRSELDVLRAYISVVNPSMWLDGASRARRPRRVKALRDLAALSGRLDRYDRLARLVRRLQADEFWLLQGYQPAATPERRRLILMHAIRAAIIQRICLLAMDIPNFSPQLGVTRDDIVARIFELDVPAAVDRLWRIFPNDGGLANMNDDYGEKSEYRQEPSFSYAIEHQALFAPMLKLYDLARRIGTAITYEIGAVG